MIPPQHLPLWQKLQRFQPGDPKAKFSFTDRLARENGWDFDRALAAISEYKKFLFLTCIAGQPLTPSDEVDQVWHLHLLYTQSYWEVLCGEVLQRPLHHGPTKGGPSEADKFTNFYENTLQLYEKTFGTPPEKYWPSSKIRFQRTNFVRIDTNLHLILPNPFLKLKTLWKNHRK